MTIQSYTGTISTKGDFIKISELTGISFTTNNIYSMQIINFAEIKIENAIFNINNEKFIYKSITENLYIRTPNGYTCTLTILENENE